MLRVKTTRKSSAGFCSLLLADIDTTFHVPWIASSGFFSLSLPSAAINKTHAAKPIVRFMSQPPGVKEPVTEPTLYTPGPDAREKRHPGQAPSPAAAPGRRAPRHARCTSV